MVRGGGTFQRKIVQMCLSFRKGVERRNDGESRMVRREDLRQETGNPEVGASRSQEVVCAFCHAAGGELEQIQFLLGHVSVQTTERYLGCKQKLGEAVNDQIGI